MSYNISFDAEGIYELKRAASEKAVTERLHNRLLEKFGAAPSAEDLLKYYNSNCEIDLPDFTQEQKIFALFDMMQSQLENLQTFNQLAIDRIAKEFSGEYDDEGYPHADD